MSARGSMNTASGSVDKSSVAGRTTGKEAAFRECFSAEVIYKHRVYGIMYARAYECKNTDDESAEKKQNRSAREKRKTKKDIRKFRRVR